MGLARRVGLFCCIILIVAAPVPVVAVDAFSLQLGELLGDDWQLSGAEARVQWSVSGRPSLDIQLPDVQLPEPLGRLTAVAVHCAELVLDQEQFGCRGGTLRGRSELLQQVSGTISLTFRRSDGRWRVVSPGLETAHGRLGLELEVKNGHWRVEVQPQSMSLAGLAGLAARWPAVTVPEGLAGSLSGKLRLTGGNAGVDAVAAEVTVDRLNFSNAAGTQAAEGLHAEVILTANRRTGRWHTQTSGRLTRGQWYAEPLYWDFTAGTPVSWQAKGVIAPDTAAVHLQEFLWQQQDVLSVHGGAAFRWQPAFAVESLDVSVDDAQLPATFQTYLQPWLGETSFAGLTTAGDFSGRFALQDTAIAELSLQLNDVTVDDPGGRFALEGLEGQLVWAEDDVERTQQVQWRAGQLYRVALGGTALELVTRGRSVRLADPVQVPVLDGQLWMDSFDLDYRQGLQWSLNAALTPVSMAALTEALEWPEMAGTLSGMVPDVRYDNGRLTMGGTLLVGVFDGDITVRNLRMADPFSAVPRLWADISIDQLDLETLTRTFSFGKIEGRLDGAVDKLYLEAWNPVAFDAWLRTPENDKSRHRISQKAVDNLSSIGGGGVGGTLSRSFLRFLEDFPYRAVGLSCRLENGVCQMGGVAPSERGYYLVQGRLLPPRIDVIGYETQVDWSSLVQRLQAVTGSEGPVVQ